MTDHEKAYRLGDEIELLAALVEANQRLLGAWPEGYRALCEADAADCWKSAVDHGINEYDADHPCRAIEARAAELRRLRPDLVLREMGAPTLPGMEVSA